MTKRGAALASSGTDYAWIFWHTILNVTQITPATSVMISLSEINIPLTVITVQCKKEIFIFALWDIQKF